MEFTAFPSWKRQKSNFGVFATFLVFLLVYAHSQRANDVAPRHGSKALARSERAPTAERLDRTCIHGKRQTNPAIESTFCE